MSVRLKHGNYYHLFNKEIDGKNLFRTKDNYRHFLKLYANHVEPIADTFAWCLMGNHFHVLVRIKEQHEIKPFEKEISYNSKTTGRRITKIIQWMPNPSKQVSNLCNAYAKAFNKQHGRSGKLFHASYEDRLVDNGRYFKHLVWYIHNNPVKHGFTTNYEDYLWTSHRTVVSLKKTNLKREVLLGWFDGLDNYFEFLDKEIPLDDIEKYIIE